MNILNQFQRWYEASSLLDNIYSELKKGKISKDTIRLVKLFYENHSEYDKEQRKKTGCCWYTDNEGVTRSISTDESEDEVFKRSMELNRK